MYASATLRGNAGQNLEGARLCGSRHWQVKYLVVAWILHACKRYMGAVLAPVTHGRLLVGGVGFHTRYQGGLIVRLSLLEAGTENSRLTVA